MAFRELRGIERELYLQAKIKQLSTIYRDAQKRLRYRLSQIDLTDFQKYRTEAILMEVNRVVKSLDQKAYVWAKSSIKQGYLRGVDLAAERLKALKVTRLVNYDSQIHTSSIGILVDKAAVDLITANQTIRNRIGTFIRTTQQQIIEDKQISKLIAEGVLQGETRREVSGSLLDVLRKEMGEERFIRINGRNYRPDKYAELVARTRTREASSQASKNTALQYGLDLVQIDVHSNACDLCQTHMGRVYSISGNTPDFPRLEEQPPYHPHCRCGLVPVTIEALQDRGQYDNIVKLSNSPNTPINSFAEFEEALNT